MKISDKLLCKYKLQRILFFAALIEAPSGPAMLTKKRTRRFFLHKKSVTHLVVIKQLLFAHVGLSNLFTFY